MQLIDGVLFHATGAAGASLCYTPQRKVRGWSWQTYWLAQGAVCWLILPVLVAWITVPSLATVLHLAPSTAMLHSLLLGMAYGIGAAAFNIAIRYIGFSLTYAISVGLSCILGTLVPPLLNGTLGTTLSGAGSSWIIGGIVMGAVGIAACGIAGRSKEKDIEKQTGSSAGFSLSKGLPLCIVAGVLSAFYGFAINAAMPIADIAGQYGAGNYRMNVNYIFSNSGTFITTLIYCTYLHLKSGTFKEYTSLSSKGSLSTNFVMAALTGILWYGQFFFYGLGHVRLGRYEFSSWAIHMILLVLLSTVTGLLMKEWKRCSPRTIRLLAAALLVLVAAVLSLTYGNFLGGTP